ncbi:MAG: hypothetical protein PHF83_03120 [Candidatus Methanomethylophilus sp.]|nr:hypothetical protein [Methanomethylophilus sp.]
MPEIGSSKTGGRIGSCQESRYCRAPVAASPAVEETVESDEGKVVCSAVGPLNIVRKMMKNGVVFGGDENVGRTFPQSVLQGRRRGCRQNT